MKTKVLFCTFAALMNAAHLPAASQPNFIVIFCDDLGYGDLGCYGSKKEPHAEYRSAGEGWCAVYRLLFVEPRLYAVSSESDDGLLSAASRDA